MVEDGGGAIFPVVFFDGEQEINMGSIRIHAYLHFKTFQSGLCQKVGLSPNQFTVYLVDRRKQPRPTEVIRRKKTVTSKANFGAIANETDSYFLVVLKRSRRNRNLNQRPKPKQVGGVELGFDYLSPEVNNPQLQNLKILQRDNYARTMMIMKNSNAISAVNLNSDSFPRVGVSRTFCEECANARREGIKPPFHWCVFDAVTVGFRSPVGPIARPRKAPSL